MTCARPAAIAIALGTSVAFQAPADAAGWRLECDTRYMLSAFRGYELDSIPVADVVVRSDGTLVTPDGIAVRIPPGSPYAMFFRPGPERRGAPLSATLEGVAWGLGVEGLSVHGTGRLVHDTSQDEWPGTEPGARLLEGYALWSAPRGSVRAGRMHETSRLGFLGYDGGYGEARLASGRLALATYGGWGLARGDDIPATSGVLDPLDDFLPERRQVVWGASGRWRSSIGQLTGIYQREVDPHAGDFVSERAGASAMATVRGIELSAGGDYDIALGSWGSAETKLGVRDRGASAEIGWRRYAPHFPLWTIWGAFSPVGYHAWSGATRVTIVRGLELLANGERWTMEETGAASPLFSVEDQGWRWSAGARWSGIEMWDARAALWREYGPGAASMGYEGSASYQWARQLTLLAAFSWLRRPLEFRFDESKAATWMMRLDWKPRGRVHASAEIQRVDETRDRPDEAAFDWGHWRAALSTVIELDSGTGPGVPAAVLRIPERPK